MAKKLFVWKLSFSVTEDDLRDEFGKIGEVASAKVITDGATGRSRGFGFVEMTSDDAADKAIASLNGKNFMDRDLNVSEAKPQKERGSGFRSGGGGGGGGDRGKRGGGGGFGGGRKNDNWR